MKSRVYGGVAAVVVLLVSTIGFVGPADAGQYNYWNSIKCGTLSNVRTASINARGDYAATLGLSGYKFAWSNAVSNLYFSACGSAAPYGNYPAPARYQKLRTEFRVSSLTLRDCTATNKFSVAKDKAGGTVSNEFSTSCSVGSTVKKRTLVTKSWSNAAYLRHGGSIQLTGTYCNYAQLAVYGTIDAPRYNFDYAPVQFVRKVTAC